jgi:hypothetical protein
LDAILSCLEERNGNSSDILDDVDCALDDFGRQSNGKSDWEHQAITLTDVGVEEFDWLIHPIRKSGGQSLYHRYSVPS